MSYLQNAAFQMSEALKKAKEKEASDNAKASVVADQLRTEQQPQQQPQQQTQEQNPMVRRLLAQTGAPSQIPAYQQREFQGGKQFDLMRQQAQGQANKAREENLATLQRRQAQLGGGPSGAFIKLEQQAGQQADEQAAGAQQNIGIAEAQAKAQFDEGEAGRAFADTQARRQQEFQSKVFQLDQFSKLGQLDLAFSQERRAQEESDADAIAQFMQTRDPASFLGMTPDQIKRLIAARQVDPEFAKKADVMGINRAKKPSFLEG